VKKENTLQEAFKFFAAELESPDVRCLRIPDGSVFRLNKENKYHSLLGPAVEMASGKNAWFINGEELTEKEFLKRKTALVAKPRNNLN